MFAGHDPIIWELLTERQVVSRAQLARAVAEQSASGQPLATVLCALGLVDPPTLFRAVADYLGCEYREGIPALLPGELLARLDARLAHAYGVVPLAADPGSLTLGAVDPLTPQLVEDLTFSLGCEIRLVVADPARVQLLVRQHYGGQQSEGNDDLLDALRRQASAMPTLETLSDADLVQLAGQAPIVRYVDQVLSQAIRDRASDIHFEPFEREFKIRCRIDGALHELAAPPLAVTRPVISRLKVLAGLNIAEKRLPQDGRLRLTVAGRDVDLRVSTLPTQFGESVVLRVLDQSAVRLELDQLGLPAGIHAAVRDIILRPNGVFIVTGPTGSGKTTTLYSCLKILNTTDAKLLTVEDPVEYEIDGIMQVPVHPAAGLGFARALRSFLRQDPDIVMVGEIRDLETAQIAIQASLTGHLVLTTLHTNDAPGAITRLVDIGVEPFLLASTIEGVLAQRLVRRICPECRKTHAPTEVQLQLAGIDPAEVIDRPFYRGTGCTACLHTGYQGRLGLFQLMHMTDGIRELVVTGASHALLRQRAAEQGMTLLRPAGLQAVLDGHTTIEEVVRYT